MNEKGPAEKVIEEISSKGSVVPSKAVGGYLGDQHQTSTAPVHKPPAIGESSGDQSQKLEGTIKQPDNQVAKRKKSSVNDDSPGGAPSKSRKYLRKNEAYQQAVVGTAVESSYHASSQADSSEMPPPQTRSHILPVGGAPNDQDNASEILAYFQGDGCAPGLDHRQTPSFCSPNPMIPAITLTDFDIQQNWQPTSVGRNEVSNFVNASTSMLSMPRQDIIPQSTVALCDGESASETLIPSGNSSTDSELEFYPQTQPGFESQDQIGSSGFFQWNPSILHSGYISSSEHAQAPSSYQGHSSPTPSLFNTSAWTWEAVPSAVLTEFPEEHGLGLESAASLSSDDMPACNATALDQSQQSFANLASQPSLVQNPYDPNFDGAIHSQRYMIENAIA